MSKFLKYTGVACAGAATTLAVMYAALTLCGAKVNWFFIRHSLIYNCSLNPQCNLDCEQPCFTEAKGCAKWIPSEFYSGPLLGALEPNKLEYTIFMRRCPDKSLIGYQCQNGKFVRIEDPQVAFYRNSPVKYKPKNIIYPSYPERLLDSAKSPCGNFQIAKTRFCSLWSRTIKQKR